MATWSIKLNPANQQQLNDVLSLNKQNQNKTFRSWFGGLAGEIFHHIKSGLKLSITQAHELDKTEAQHILIQAAMVQQQCMQHYRVYHDLKTAGINDMVLHDLLLFIRMSNYHPSSDDLHHYQQHSHVTESADHLKILLDELEEKKLIQKIIVNNNVFYDKNPYPHCHLFDTETGRISDYDCHLNSLQTKRFLRIPHAGVNCL